MPRFLLHAHGSRLERKDDAADDLRRQTKSTKALFLSAVLRHGKAEHFLIGNLERRNHKRRTLFTKTLQSVAPMSWTTDFTLHDLALV